jgi:hypothetical protein
MMRTIVIWTQIVILVFCGGILSGNGEWAEGKESKHETQSKSHQILVTAQAIPPQTPIAQQDETPPKVALPPKTDLPEKKGVVVVGVQCESGDRKGAEPPRDSSAKSPPSPFSDEIVRKMFTQVSEHILSSHKVTEWSILVLTAAILAATFFVSFFSYTTNRNLTKEFERFDKDLTQRVKQEIGATRYDIENRILSNINERVDSSLYAAIATNLHPTLRAFERETRKEVVRHVGLLLDTALTRKLEDKLKQLMEKADEMIQLHIESDFAPDLEARGLAAQYVISATNDILCDKMIQALADGDQMEYLQLQTYLSRLDLALAQLLSSQPKDVFTGLGALESFAQQNLVPPDSLWEFICLLKKQGRLSGNTHLALKIGKAMGKHWEDCGMQSKSNEDSD